MSSFRRLQVEAKRDFPEPGGEHYYGSGRKTFSCEVKISGPAPSVKEKYKLHCSLFLPDGTESRGLLDDSAWSWNVAGHGNDKNGFVAMPATLTFNFKKATGKLIMVHVSVLEVNSDPTGALLIEPADTTTFWVKSKRKQLIAGGEGRVGSGLAPALGSLGEAGPSTQLSGMKRTFSDSSEASYESSIETVCKWTEIAMETMNKVKRSRSTEDADRDSLMDAMSQCHKLRVYEALSILRKQETAVIAEGSTTGGANVEDEDLSSLLMEFWEDAAMAEQEDGLSTTDSTSMATTPDPSSLLADFSTRRTLKENSDKFNYAVLQQHQQPASQGISPSDVPGASLTFSMPMPTMSRRIYSEGSSKGRVLSQLIGKFRARS